VEKPASIHSLPVLLRQATTALTRDNKSPFLAHYIMMQNKGSFLGNSAFTFGVSSKAKHRDLVSAPHTMLTRAETTSCSKVLLPDGN